MAHLPSPVICPLLNSPWKVAPSAQVNVPSPCIFPSINSPTYLQHKKIQFLSTSLSNRIKTSSHLDAPESPDHEATQPGSRQCTPEPVQQLSGTQRKLRKMIFQISSCTFPQAQTYFPWPPYVPRDVSKSPVSFILKGFYCQAVHSTFM